VAQLVVATECPSCGAPLDLPEGANTVRCGSCRSNLLVTGRTQVLTYHVAPRVSAEAARAQVTSSQPMAQVVAADLHFIPYYRLTGHELRWERAVPPDTAGDDGEGRPRDALLTLLRGEQDEARALATAVLGAGRAAARSPDAGPLRLVDRYVEKSFVAGDLPGFGVYSLGVRSQVLRVGLVRSETLAPLGKAVGVALDAAAATARGLKDEAAARVVHRQVLARVLSVIYFPCWVVEMQQQGEGWLAIVDGVTQAIAQAQAPLALRRALGVAPPRDLPTAGFRPLVCPNCGWDLPGRAEDVVFCCGSCERAWQVAGTAMSEVAYEIVEVAEAGASGDAVYLPLWRLESGARTELVPAFRYRRLKALADLTTRLAAGPRALGRRTGPRPPLRGCFYDAADAARLARLVAAGKDQPWSEPSHASLVWLPFPRQGPALLDPFTGMALEERLLV
jgi:LSD1 subclass zinc finger protein